MIETLINIVLVILAIVVGLFLYTYRYRPDLARRDWEKLKELLRRHTRGK